MRLNWKRYALSFGANLVACLALRIAVNAMGLPESALWLGVAMLNAGFIVQGLMPFRPFTDRAADEQREREKDARYAATRQEYQDAKEWYERTRRAMEGKR